MATKLYSIRETVNHLRNKFGVRITPRTLQKYRSEGGGPKFFKIANKILYSEEDMTTWVESHKPMENIDQGRMAS